MRSCLVAVFDVIGNNMMLIVISM